VGSVPNVLVFFRTLANTEFKKQLVLKISFYGKKQAQMQQEDHKCIKWVVFQSCGYFLKAVSNLTF
jgi:hypothetical protein